MNTSPTTPDPEVLRKIAEEFQAAPSRIPFHTLIRLRSTLHPPPGSRSFAFRISRRTGFSHQLNHLELSTFLKFLTFRLKRRTIKCYREHRDKHFNQARRCRTQNRRRTGNLRLWLCCMWDG